MIDLEKGEIIDILPSLFTSDSDTIAFSHALKAGIDLTNKYAERTMLYADIDHLPEYLLDYIAVELNAEYYLESYDIDKKKSIIKNALYWKMKAGSKTAVEELIQAIFGKGKVIEYYNSADGIPGTFEIETDAIMTPDMIERFNILIKDIKKASAHLQRVETKHEVECNTVVAITSGYEAQQIITNDICIDNPDEAYLNSVYAACFDYEERIDNTYVTMNESARDCKNSFFYYCSLIPNSCQEI